MIAVNMSFLSEKPEPGIDRRESSVALYLLLLMFAGVGVNMISHVLIEHLKGAERRFDKDHK